ncbi:MAG: response regulator transcription factor [Flavobacteriales bacterium]
MKNGDQKRIDVLVVEDHSIYRQAIVDTLRESAFVMRTGQAENGVQALAELSRATYDLVILDISMPEMHGIDCMTEISAKYPDQKVIVLTQFDSTGFYKRFEALGVSGYLLKSSTGQEIIDDIRRVMFDNERVFTDRVEKEYWSLDKTHHVYLSEKEMEVVQLICSHLKTEQIAERLNLSTHTINSHRKHILTKLGAAAATQIIEWAIDNGVVIR